jgi:hypothetical protein
VFVKAGGDVSWMNFAEKMLGNQTHTRDELKYKIQKIANIMY